MWKPNTHRFKVICQRCGVTGEVDFDKTMGDQGFFALEEEDDKGDLTFEYYLCTNCLHALEEGP